MNGETSEKKYLVCTKPFEWYEIAWNKEVYLCCPGWLGKSAGKAITDSAIDIWNSSDAKKIRNSVIDGSFLYCNAEHCPHLINKTHPVKYVDEAELEALEDKAEQAGRSDNLPGWVNFSYDQSCNLACPSCRNEIVIASKEERDQFQHLANNTLSTFGSSIKELYITGSGDPFASRHFWELLRSNEISKHQDLSLRIHTNGQLCTPRRWEMIQHIESNISTLEISVDAASTITYSLNRSPGDWETLCQNLEFLAKLRKDRRIKRLQLDFVVQNNNFLEMKHFIQLAKAWNADLVYFSPLNNWGTFSDSDYNDRAVHRPGHRNHAKLIDVLRDPIMQDPIVYCGFINLALATDPNMHHDSAIDEDRICAVEI